MNNQLIDLEKRLSAIENRNKRVETDKAWEGSYTRRILIVIFTFISILAVICGSLA